MAKRGKQKHKARPQSAQDNVQAGVGGAVLMAAEASQPESAEVAGVPAVFAEDLPQSEPLQAQAPEMATVIDDAPASPVRAQPRRPRARELRSPYLVLADYEQRSLAHVAGLPEQLDAPGLWRGVAYRVGSHHLASGFNEVVEILPLPALTHVPGALPWMLGVANIRGSLLPVVDLKQFLEGERTVLHERQRVLVVRQPGGDVAVTIDELYGQRSFVDAQGIDATAMTEGRFAHFVDRAYRMNDQDWGVFSLERLARTPEFRQAAA